MSAASEFIDGIEEFRRKHPDLLHPASATGVSVNSIIAALEQFMECVRYLNTRRSSTSLLLESEGAVQDALYLMLRPWIHDLIPESPTERVANRYAIKDFASYSLRTVVEAKYIRDKDHGKSITRELNDDIETYRYHLYCDHLVFFIYDPDGNIPDATALKTHICDARMYGGKVLHCHSIIRP